MSKKFLFSVTLDDCDVQTFTVGGHGGSGKDTSNTGVRIVHRASGAVGTGRDERSQVQNKRAAFRRMAESPTFKTWIRMTAAAQQGQKPIEEWVEEQMLPKNLKVEVRDGQGKWVLS